MLLAVNPTNQENTFEFLFKEMTYDVKFIYEVSSLTETLDQANAVIAEDYSGIFFL